MPHILKHLVLLLDRAYGYFSWVLLGFFILIGGTFTFLMPPFQAPDEPSHWETANQRVTDLLGGEETGVCSLFAALEAHFEASTISFRPAVKQAKGKFDTLQDLTPRCTPRLIGYGTVLTYPGVLLARLMTSSATITGPKTLSIFYLARLLQGTLIALLLARLLWHAHHSDYPGGTLSLAALFLSPILVQQSFGISADLVINAFAVTLATTLIHLPRLTRLDLTLLLLLGFSASTTKPIIVVLTAGLIVLIWVTWMAPLHFGWKFESRISKKRIWTVTVILTVLSIIAVQSGLSQSSLVKGASKIPGADGQQQIAYILGHPLDALAALIDGLSMVTPPRLLFNYLGWRETTVPATIISRGLDLLWNLVLFDALRLAYHWWPSRRRISVVHSLMSECGLVVTILGFFFLNALTMYLAWTPVGASSVEGLQARYLLPGLLMGLGCVPYFWDRGRLLAKTPPDHQDVLHTWCLRSLRLLAFGLAIYLVKYGLGLCQALLTRYW